MADSISDTRNIARSVANAADSSVSFSDQGVAPQKSENEHRQPSVEKDAALHTCQARLEPDGSKTGLLDNISEQGDSILSEEMTTEEIHKHLEALENRLEKLLSELASVFTEPEINEVQEFIDVGEYVLAFETLVDIVNEESKTISQEMFLKIMGVKAMMKTDIADVERRLAGHVSDG